MRCKITLNAKLALQQRVQALRKIDLSKKLRDNFRLGFAIIFVNAVNPVVWPKRSPLQSSQQVARQKNKQCKYVNTSLKHIIRHKVKINATAFCETTSKKH